MLYRVETGLHANITDTQGRKTALHLLKALQIPVAAIRHRFVGERGRAGSRGAGQHRNRDKQCGEFSHPHATPAYEAGKRVLHPLHDMSISHGAAANCLCASMP